MYKSCLLFVLHSLTTKTELIMLVQYLKIDLTNAAICILSYSSAFMNVDLLNSQSFFPQNIGGGSGGGGGGGSSQSIGNVNHPCAVLFGYTRSWIPIHQVIGSYVMLDRRRQYELRQEYSFLLFSKVFIALQVFIYHKFRDFIFFGVFDGFLKIILHVTFILA